MWTDDSAAAPFPNSGWQEPSLKSYFSPSVSKSQRERGSESAGNQESFSSKAPKGPKSDARLTESTTEMTGVPASFFFAPCRRHRILLIRSAAFGAGPAL